MGSGTRRTIAARLIEAKQTIPHFYLTADVTLDALNRLREEANAGAPEKDGKPAYKLSLNDFVIKALALAMQRVPAANAVWAGDGILRFQHSDIGVAVALDGGLITPVIHNAEMKSLSAISNEMKELATRARAKKLKEAETNLSRASAQRGAEPKVRQNLALVVGLQGRFQEAETIAKGDLSPDEAAANVAYLRQMLAQQSDWKPQGASGSQPHGG